MKLKSIDLSQFGPHDHLHLDFVSGLNCICGKNGSGKSTVFTAIKGALNNTWEHPEGQKGIIRKLSPTGSSKIKLELFMDSDNSVAEITRIIDANNAKHSLTFMVDNEKRTISKPTEIKNWLEQVLFLTNDIINNYMFIPQGQLYSFLDVTPKSRMDSFSKLCGTTIAEKCREYLKKLITVDEATASAKYLLADVASRKAQIESNNETINTLTEQISRCEAELAALPDTSGLNKMQTDLVEASTATAKINTLQISIDSLKRSIASLNTEIQSSDEEYSYCKNFVETNEEAYKQALIFVNTYNENFKIAETVKTYNDNISLLESELSLLTEPVLDDSLKDIKLGELVIKLNILSADLTSCQRLLPSATTLTQTVVCPTCGAEEKHWVLKPKDIEADIARLSSEIRILEDQRDKLEKYNFDVQKYEYSKTNKTTQLNQFKELLQTLPEITYVSLDKFNQCQQLIEQYTQSNIALYDSNRRLTDSKLLLTSITSELDYKQRELKGLIPKSQKEDSLRDQIQKLNVIYKEFLKLESEKSDCYSQIKLLNKQQEEHQAWLDQQTNRIAMFDRQNKFIGYMSRAAEVLHTRCLPNLIHTRVLNDMTYKLNSELQEFDADFFVSSNPDLSFYATFFRGPNKDTTLPASTLSGGQKTLLSLAYWMSIQQLFAKHIGIMCLDEPCSFLDKNNRDKLIDVFLKVRERLNAKNQQMLIVSHEDNLWPAFDKIHNLDIIKE